MTGRPKRYAAAQQPEAQQIEKLEHMLDAANKKIEWLEEELRIERYGKFVRARRASYGNGAHQ